MLVGHVCLACHRVEKEEVIVINVEEHVSPRNLWPQLW
jgi:hypothetical protein